MISAYNLISRKSNFSSYERFWTKTYFQTDAQGDSEMAYRQDEKQINCNKRKRIPVRFISIFTIICCQCQVIYKEVNPPFRKPSQVIRRFSDHACCVDVFLENENAE